MRTEARPAPPLTRDDARPGGATPARPAPFCRPRFSGAPRPPRRHSPWWLVAPAVACAACYGGTMRVVQQTPASGEVALVGERADARARAESYMSRQCPAGYYVVDEGETAVGDRAPGDGSRAKAAPDSGGALSDVTEWRIRYQCKNELGLALPAYAPAQPPRTAASASPAASAPPAPPPVAPAAGAPPAPPPVAPAAGPPPGRAPAASSEPAPAPSTTLPPSWL